jgi:anti-sigma factor RsiW
MLTCDAADALIVQEADGVLADRDRERLASHLASCERCRECRAANVAVRRVLSARPDAEVRGDFAERIAARVAAAEGPAWLPQFDWRRWTAWTLPVTAALMIVAGYAGLTAPTTSASTPSAAEAVTTTADTSAAIENWLLGGESDSGAAASALRPDVSSDDLLAGMVGAQPAASAEGQRDGR